MSEEQAVVTKTATVVTPASGGGTLALQLLLYVFSGWLVISLVWLAGVVFNALFNSAGSISSYINQMVAFPLSAAIVLLIAIAICEAFYYRREPIVKQRAAKAIALIHVIIFTLMGVGFLISLVFNLVSGLLGVRMGLSENLATILTALVGVVGFGALVMRILWARRSRVLYIIIMALFGLIVVGLTIGGVVGPAAQSRLAAQDESMVRGVQYVAREVNSYAQKNDALPTNLRDIDLSNGSNAGDAKQLIDKSQIRYTPDIKAAQTGTVTDLKYPSNSSTKRVFYYRLCVTFNARSSSYFYAEPTSQYKTPYYPTYPDVYQHDKGEQCYDLQTADTYYPAIYDDTNSSSSAVNQ